ncbi:acyltransferase family protein [Novosphingobium mangrovi (ex Huang et al. 2023)]|uniref:Acyltransferase n=1 Tax=Novosphingobium mangrovi (ex Huang et al. 2023) TaxID=2976432 RepID=A0ABT2I162_9SPHN|nr:acyltransferase [Novosphingobium mangrovi (ex Huang et al. 2023)]MCT2398538.1 acyltransferase [Novosphingobium mangrovi (ex Huang et al. 2023)]
MKRLEGLDALRGIAALLVAVGHAYRMAGIEIFFLQHYLVVDFFFLLSGFVMAMSADTSDPARFIVSRWRRLWLPMAAGAVMGLVVAHVADGDSLQAAALPFIAAVMLIPYGGGTFPLNPPAWSITFELVANAVHALFLGRARNLFLVAIVAGSALLIAASSDTMDIGWEDTLWLAAPRVLMTYCLGMLIYRLNGTTARLHWTVAAAGLPAMVLLASTWPGRTEIVFVLAFTPMVLLAGLGWQPAWGRILGAFSFPLYALHWNVERAMLKADFGPEAMFCASLAAVFIIGLLIDRRCRSALRDFVGTATPNTSRRERYSPQMLPEHAQSGD